EAAATADPNNVEALRLWSIFLEQQSDYQTLADVYTRVALLEPDNPDVLVAKASANARIGNADDAISDLATVSEFDSTREYAWVNVAGSAQDARQYDSAIQIAQAGLKVYPSSTGLLESLGLSQLSLMRLEEARNTFDQLLAISPDDTTALYWQGRTLMK